jgi:hypothetical protein
MCQGMQRVSQLFKSFNAHLNTIRIFGFSLQENISFRYEYS